MRSLVPHAPMSPAQVMPPPVAITRDARRRGQALRVGLELDVPDADPESLDRLADSLAHMASHRLANVWLHAADPAAGAAAIAAVRSRPAAPPVQLVVPVTAHARAGSPSAEPGEERAWLWGGVEACAEAAASDHGWIATGLRPSEILQALQALGDDPADGPAEVGVRLHVGCAPGDAPRAPDAANGWGSARHLIERHIAVGASIFVLRPVTEDLDRWLHEVGMPLSDLDEEGHAPCGC